MQVSIVKINNGYMIKDAESPMVTAMYVPNLDEVAIRLRTFFKEIDSQEAVFELEKVRKDKS